MTAFEKAVEALDEALARNERVILALEGPAASGKTTLARRLGERYAAPVISMDEFFLPPALRTADRLAQPGGNIHYERFLDQAARPLQEGRPFSYQVFDCSKGCLTLEKQVRPGRLVIVEGVYSLHPLYRHVYTHRFFLACSPESQDQRLRARGEWLYGRFQQDWLPMEERYFAVCKPRDCCDLVLCTDED